MTIKKTKLEIRCSEETKKKFKVLVAKGGFRSYEDCLLFLLEFGERILESQPRGV